MVSSNQFFLYSNIQSVNNVIFPFVNSYILLLGLEILTNKLPLKIWLRKVCQPAYLPFQEEVVLIQFFSEKRFFTYLPQKDAITVSFPKYDLPTSSLVSFVITCSLYQMTNHNFQNNFKYVMSLGHREIFHTRFVRRSLS